MDIDEQESNNFFTISVRTLILFIKNSLKPIKIIF